MISFCDGVLRTAEYPYHGLASGHLGFYKLFQNEWKPKYSESPLESVSESGLICLLTPNTSLDTVL